MDESEQKLPATSKQSSITQTHIPYESEILLQNTKNATRNVKSKIIKQLNFKFNIKKKKSVRSVKYLKYNNELHIYVRYDSMVNDPITITCHKYILSQFKRSNNKTRFNKKKTNTIISSDGSRQQREWHTQQEEVGENRKLLNVDWLKKFYRWNKVKPTIN